VSTDDDDGQCTCICTQLGLHQDCDTIKKSNNVSLDVYVTVLVATFCEDILQDGWKNLLLQYSFRPKGKVSSLAFHAVTAGSALCSYNYLWCFLESKIERKFFHYIAFRIHEV